MMDNKTRDLIIEISEGNPGALTVIKELQYFNKWIEMLYFMKRNNFTGHKIWETYKDKFHCSILDFGNNLETEMFHERELANYHHPNSRKGGKGR